MSTEIKDELLSEIRAAMSVSEAVLAQSGILSPQARVMEANQHEIKIKFYPIPNSIAKEIKENKKKGNGVGRFTISVDYQLLYNGMLLATQDQQEGVRIPQYMIDAIENSSAPHTEIEGKLEYVWTGGIGWGAQQEGKMEYGGLIIAFDRSHPVWKGSFLSGTRVYHFNVAGAGHHAETNEKLDEYMKLEHKQGDGYVSIVVFRDKQNAVDPDNALRVMAMYGEHWEYGGNIGFIPRTDAVEICGFANDFSKFASRIIGIEKKMRDKHGNIKHDHTAKMAAMVSTGSGEKKALVPVPRIELIMVEDDVLDLCLPEAGFYQIEM